MPCKYNAYKDTASYKQAEKERQQQMSERKNSSRVFKQMHPNGANFCGYSEHYTKN